MSDFLPLIFCVHLEQDRGKRRGDLVAEYRSIPGNNADVCAARLSFAFHPKARLIS